MTIKGFSKCTRFSSDGDVLTVSCKLGLWSASGEDYCLVVDEALHYFKQYRDDGEYYNIIGGESPINKLTKGR
jgi:hypothetical protein